MPLPVPLVVKVSMYPVVISNWASTVLLPSMVRDCGVVVPVRSPLKPAKVDPTEALAQIVTTAPQ